MPQTRVAVTIKNQGGSRSHTRFGLDSTVNQSQVATAHEWEIVKKAAKNRAIGGRTAKTSSETLRQ